MEEDAPVSHRGAPLCLELVRLQEHRPQHEAMEPDATRHRMAPAALLPALQHVPQPWPRTHPIPGTLQVPDPAAESCQEEAVYLQPACGVPSRAAKSAWRALNKRERGASGAGDSIRVSLKCDAVG